MRGGQGILHRFLLVLAEDTPPATMEAAKELVRAWPDVVELRVARHPGLALVRPDGYVAYATTRHAGAAAVAPARALLELQMRPSQRSAA